MLRALFSFFKKNRTILENMEKFGPYMVPMKQFLYSSSSFVYGLVLYANMFIWIYEFSDNDFYWFVWVYQHTLYVYCVWRCIDRKCCYLCALCELKYGNNNGWLVGFWFQTITRLRFSGASFAGWIPLLLLLLLVILFCSYHTNPIVERSILWVCSLFSAVWLLPLQPIDKPMLIPLPMKPFTTIK